MINKDKKLFRWGPIDGMPLYIHAFNKAFVKMKDRMGYSINDLFNYFKDWKVTIVTEDEELRKFAIPPFKNIIMDDNKVMNHFEIWEKKVACLKAFEEVVNHGISHCNDEKLLKLFEEWCTAHLDFWDYGFLPELANWGGEKLLKDSIKEKWENKFNEIFEALAAPDKLSFFQNEEMEFLGIVLMENENMQDIMLHDHAKKYYWLRNSYGNTSLLPTGHFELELEKMSKEKAKKKMDEIGRYSDKIKARKKEIIEKYNIDDETIKISEKLAYCVWWQDLRKKYIFIANHINSVFAQEFALREEIGFDQLQYYTEDDIINLIKNHEFVDVEKRKQSFIILYENDSLKYLEGEEAEKFAKPYFEYDVKNKNEVDGMIVSVGEDPLTVGTVKILSSPKELDKMEDGDILVAAMTSPDYIVAMRKASAIVTDEGGMTSHAAIVSRELGIPCIVATEIATKVFKDGDVIEIDTDKGFVRKIK